MQRGIGRLRARAAADSGLVLPNLFTSSEAFNADPPWSRDSVTITANDATDPLGGSTADRIANSGTAYPPLVYQNIAVTAGQHVVSIYAKKGGANFLTIYTYDGADIVKSGFNLDTGAVDLTGTGHTPAIEAIGSGWYRCSLSYNFPSTTLRMYAGAYKTTGTPSYTPGVAEADYIHIWGAMANTGTELAIYEAT
jgi:hypothetical protein